MAALFPYPDWVYEQMDVVNETDDIEILFDIIKNHPFPEVRENAIKRIGDEDILDYVAKNDSNKYNRVTVVFKTKNKSTLIYLAKNDSEEFIRIEAEKRLKQLGYVK